jgi:hypothetical protein
MNFSHSSFRKFYSVWFICFLFFVCICFSSCSSLRRSQKPSSNQEYSEGDIRPFLRLKTLYYFEKGIELVDISELPFVPLQTGREFGYVIPVRDGAPEWKIREILTVTCEEGFPVHPRHQSQRVIEWAKPPESLKIQSHNEFDETDCPGKYEFQVHIDGFLMDRFTIYVKKSSE